MRRQEAGRNRDGVKLRQKLCFNLTVRQILHNLYTFFLIVIENEIQIQNFPSIQMENTRK